jgi:hypothetical protein
MELKLVCTKQELKQPQRKPEIFGRNSITKEMY